MQYVATEQTRPFVSKLPTKPNKPKRTTRTQYTTSATPDWAITIAESVQQNFSTSRTPATLPTIMWAHDTNDHLSMGSYESVSNVLRVRQGTCPIEAGITLLHELAHWVQPREHHSALFWQTAFTLYKHYKLPKHYTICTELRYKMTALYGAHAIYRLSSDDWHYYVAYYQNRYRIPRKQYTLPDNPTSGELFWYSING